MIQVAEEYCMVRQDVAWSNRGNIGEHSGQLTQGIADVRCPVFLLQGCYTVTLLKSSRQSNDA